MGGQLGAPQPTTQNEVCYSNVSREVHRLEFIERKLKQMNARWLNLIENTFCVYFCD